MRLWWRMFPMVTCVYGDACSQRCLTCVYSGIDGIVKKWYSGKIYLIRNTFGNMRRHIRMSPLGTCATIYTCHLWEHAPPYTHVTIGNMRRHIRMSPLGTCIAIYAFTFGNMRLHIRMSPLGTCAACYYCG